MIAMQYSLPLPADYDMGVIDRRIHEKGALLDGFPHLRFKAYLCARKGEMGSRENIYAPFYAWDEAEGASAFLTGPGFAGVSGDFGWPQVNIWIIWACALSSNLRCARFAARTITPLAPHAPLADLRARSCDEAHREVAAGGALASVAAFEPTTWTMVRFALWDQETRLSPASKVQVYRVGYVAEGGAPSGSDRA